MSTIKINLVKMLAELAEWFTGLNFNEETLVGLFEFLFLAFIIRVLNGRRRE